MKTTAMNKLLLIIVLLVSSAFSPVAIPEGNAAREVKKALEGQISAWNKGKLEEAMAFYWNSKQMLWISKSGVERGFEEVLNVYRNEFADSRDMGVYSYEPLHLEEVSPDAVYFVFRWEINLDDNKLMGGVSSQLWKKKDGRWVITLEHAS